MKNKKWMTLIELIVVILLISILLAISSSFFNWIMKSSQHKKIVFEVELFNDFFKKQKLSDFYLKDYYNIDSYKALNSMNKDEFTDIFYSVYIIKPVLVNKYDNQLKPLKVSEIWNSNNDYKDITIWLQSCKFLFDIKWNSISGKNSNNICDEPFIWNGVINLQGFLIWNDLDVVVEKNRYEFNPNNYFWNLYDIYSKDDLLIKEGESKTKLDSLWYVYFDIFYDRLSKFYSNNFFIYKLRKLDWKIEQWIFYWNENSFTDLIKNKYIPWVLNNSVLNFSNLANDREFRKNMKIWDFNSIQLLYHDPNDFSEGYKEILPIWIFK